MKIDKVVRIGTTNSCGTGISVYCKIKYADDRLSITGVEGPKRNGDAFGSCGQITIVPEEITPAPGWNTDLITRFAAVWDRWHLNDMRAGCEHQRASGRADAMIEVVTYKMTSEAYRLRNEAIEEARKAAMEGRVANLTSTGRALISPDWYKDKFTPPDANSPLSGMYEVKSRETKRAGWVNQQEHPAGMLSAPCEVCGYKYGTAWLKETVPDDVLAFLSSLPDTDKTPYWV